MTKSDLIQYLWKLDAAQLEQITESSKYSVIDQAVNKAVLRVNIPAVGNCQSGKMETAIPAFWKPAFRRNGNRCSAGAYVRC